MRQLSDAEKEEFKALHLKGHSATSLARKYKMRNKTALDFINSCSGEYSKSFMNAKRKLTKYQVIKILIERMKYGTLQKDLAKKYNVSDSRISIICTGREWKHVFQGVKDKYNTEILSIKSPE